MIAKLRLDRAMYLADLGMKYNVVEFLDHLPRVKFTQITTPLARRALRVIFRSSSEISARFNLGLKFFAGLLSGHQNVARAGFGHSVLRQSRCTQNMVVVPSTRRSPSA